MTSVLLVDDQRLIRDGFRLIVNAEPDLDVVGEADSGAEAVRQAALLRPDVVLMDVRMPGGDGIEATRSIVSRGLPSKVLILTTFDVDDYVFGAFRAGASGFLLKNAPAERLVEGIRCVAAGEALLAPAPTRRLIESHLTQSKPSRDQEQQLAALSTREREVLLLIATGRSNGEIAQELYLSTGTVKTHVTRLLTKLGLRDRVQATVFAYETGLAKPGRAVPAEDDHDAY